MENATDSVMRCAPCTASCGKSFRICVNGVRLPCVLAECPVLCPQCSSAPGLLEKQNFRLIQGRQVKCPVCLPTWTLWSEWSVCHSINKQLRSRNFFAKRGSVLSPIAGESQQIRNCTYYGLIANVNTTTNIPIHPHSVAVIAIIMPLMILAFVVICLCCLKAYNRSKMLRVPRI